ncbi:hypothetical protein I3760_01G253800 [Carya illinoinensis]|nr:hypothetical protein I3760_01G253800 [Carya illinoinensis]
MRETWWQNVTLRSISLCGKFLMVVLRIKLKFSGQILWLSKQTTRMMNQELWMLCWPGGPFSLGRQTHSLGSIPYGRQHQILPVDKLAYIGTAQIPVLPWRHFLKCPPGTLGKHFEKLIQCDPRLNFLSQQHEIVLDCPFFEPGVAVFEDLNESSHVFDLNGEARPAFLGLGDVASPSQAQSSSTKNEQDYIGRNLENFSQETSSPSSVMDTNAIEEIRSIEGKSSKLLGHLDQIKVPGFHPSMSMSDLVSHIENCIAEQMTSENPVFSGMKQHGIDILEEITQYLFSDSQLTSASDEQSLMSRVNSLCCLLQKDPSPAQKLQAERDDDGDGNADQKIGVAVAAAANKSKPADESPAPWVESIGVSGCKQPQAMSRKDSFADLLLNLPRIASLPQFLFSLPEDSDNQAR